MSDDRIRAGEVELRRRLSIPVTAVKRLRTDGSSYGSPPRLQYSGRLRSAGTAPELSGKTDGAQPSRNWDAEHPHPQRRSALLA